MARKKPACTSCGDIVEENVKVLDGKIKCEDCYLELTQGTIKIPEQTFKPPHANLTTRQKIKLN